VAVLQQVILPAQPTNGTVEYVPLGGDGYTAPHGAYLVKSMELAGDASAGKAQNAVIMDARFCSLLSYATLQIVQATPADADFRMVFGTSIDQGAETATATTLSTVTVSRTWRPVPLIQPGGGAAPTLFILAENVNGDDYFLDALIYVFNIRAREIGPLGYLLWAQGAS